MWSIEASGDTLTRLDAKKREAVLPVNLFAVGPSPDGCVSVIDTGLQPEFGT